MTPRRIGSFSVSPIGYGCMGLSHAYGLPPDREDAERLLLGALDLGYDFFDTASTYGFGHNEALVGEVLSPHRARFTLASKCGIGRNAAGKREINGRPEALLAACDESLRRLRTEVIDLYYLHRWDKRVPIEESVGALARMVEAGKVRTIGLSEVSAATIRKAHAVHPVTAVQSEYSLWTRNPEIAVLETCREIGAAFVAFGSVGRGFLAGSLRDPAQLPAGDIRLGMPRFQGENFQANLKLVERLGAIARDAGGSKAQICLAWVVSRGEHVVSIPGTTRLDHLKENARGAYINLSADLIARLDSLAAETHGERYSQASQSEVDTERFEAALA
jgi:aryl-alcohol dehydrogenase-like predicted oxidoreductase